MDENENIKDFSERFFSNLGCKCSWNEKVLVIENVPASFEKFFGKKSPYFLVFQQENCNNNEELMTKGSYLLKSMATWLENLGQTGLLKINLDISDTQIKNWFKFRNCEVYNIKKKVQNKSFYKFTFQTTYQYLNEREQISSSFYLQDGSIIEFNLDSFNVSDGKKNEANSQDIKPSYLSAKEALKNIIAQKIKELEVVLETRLEKEIGRIKHHYSSQIKEKQDQLEKSTDSLNQLEKTGKPDKIARAKEHIQDLKNSFDFDKIKKEEEFFIADENRKHSLSVDTKLINTTIIYYPIYHISIFLKNNSGRQIELIYDPLKKEKSSISCDICKNQISELVLDSCGHLICAKCGSRCSQCSNISCNNCLSKCEYCKRIVCKKCMSRCQKCGKLVCKSHIKKDSMCINCLKQCSVCKDYFEISKIKNCSCGREICYKCSPMEMKIINSRDHCSNCSKLCTLCGKTRAVQDFKRCVMCKSESCNFPGKCISCRKQLCPKKRE
jgi:hypothetical protein